MLQIDSWLQQNKVTPSTFTHDELLKIVLCKCNFLNIEVNQDVLNKRGQEFWCSDVSEMIECFGYT